MSMSSKMEKFFWLPSLSEESSPLESVELSACFDLEETDDFDLDAVEERLLLLADECFFCSRSRSRSPRCSLSLWW